LDTKLYIRNKKYSVRRIKLKSLLQKTMFLSAASLRGTALRHTSRFLRCAEAKTFTSTTKQFPILANAITQNCRLFSDIDKSDDVIKGQVKWFDVKKGFGFIVPTDGGEDVFVHQTDIHARGFRSLAEGEEVEFEVVEEDNGRRKAKGVTGPEGDYVQGAPKEPRYDPNEEHW